MVRIIGIEDVHYTSKRTGNEVRGKKLYYTQPLSEKKGKGLSCDSVFVSNEIAQDIDIDFEVELLFNKYGNVVDIRLAEFC